MNISKILLTGLSATLLFAGCKKVELVPLSIFCNFQSEDILSNFYTSNGETLQFSLVVDKEKSTKNLSIRQIEVFMNNIKIAEEFNNDRIDVEYLLKNKTLGKNPLRISLTGMAPNYLETTIHLTMDVNVFENKPIYGFELFSDDVWNNGTSTNISIKEIINSTLKLNINSISFELDNSQIGVVCGNETKIVYNVKDIPIGEHILSAQINCSTLDGISTIITKSKHIIVK